MQHSISIIIPVYNTEKYISKCLDSILVQEYTNWEAILVNDGSTDGSGAICDRYAEADNRFKVLRQNNQGVVAARNNAIAIAKGYYLAFVDSDDYIAPTMLKEMVANAEERGTDIVWCNSYEVNYDRRTEERITLDKDNDINIRNLLTSKLPGYLWNKLIRKDFWDRCNIKTDKEAVICEDTYISIQLLANNPKVDIIGKCLYFYVKYNSDAATAHHTQPITVRAEKNIENIYIYLKEEGLLDRYYEEFCSLALRLKMEMLPFDTKKAVNIYPFAHRDLKKYKFPFIISLYYWLIFNSGFVGRALLKIKKLKKE